MAAKSKLQRMPTINRFLKRQIPRGSLSKGEQDCNDSLLRRELTPNGQKGLHLPSKWKYRRKEGIKSLSHAEGDASLSRASSSLERTTYLTPTKTLGEYKKLPDPWIKKVTWSVSLERPLGKVQLFQTLT